MSARKAYWHKIPKEDQEAILKFSQRTLGEHIGKFKQPDWCGYPEALRGGLGCWSLIRAGWIVSKSYCKKCDERLTK